MIDNFVNTKFKLEFLITLTLEICFLIFWLCLEFLGGEWLICYMKNIVFKPPFIQKLHNYLNIIYIVCIFNFMRYFRISSIFSHKWYFKLSQNWWRYLHANKLCCHYWLLSTRYIFLKEKDDFFLSTTLLRGAVRLQVSLSNKKTLLAVFFFIMLPLHLNMLLWNIRSLVGYHSFSVY